MPFSFRQRLQMPIGQSNIVEPRKLETMLPTSSHRRRRNAGGQNVNLHAISCPLLIQASTHRVKYTCVMGWWQIKVKYMWWSTSPNDPVRRSVFVVVSQIEVLVASGRIMRVPSRLFNFCQPFSISDLFVYFLLLDDRKYCSISHASEVWSPPGARARLGCI